MLVLNFAAGGQAHWRQNKSCSAEKLIEIKTKDFPSQTKASKRRGEMPAKPDCWFANEARRQPANVAQNPMTVAGLI